MRSDLARAVESADLRALHAQLQALDLPSVVDELERLDPTDRALAFRVLPKARAVRAFENLAPEIQAELVRALRSEAVARLVADLDPDDRAQLLDELPAGVASRLLSRLTEHERAMTVGLLGYPEESVGRRMTPELVRLPADLTAAEALERARAADDAETVYVMPVVDPGRVVVGVVSLRRLLVTDPGLPVRAVMSEPILVRATDDQEDAAHVVRSHGAVAVPVVDHEDRLLGLLTFDDAMRILQVEEDEDTAISGGTTPLRRPYLSTSVWRLVRSRVTWLLVLILAATLTVNVLDHFEESLAEVVSLALFIPLLIGTGGNVGAQAATTVIRAIAVDDVRFGDVPRVLRREFLTGISLGLLLAVIGYLPARLLVGPEVALVICLSLIAVCTLAASAGGLIPLLARWSGVDPAVVSAPFITTLVDASGLVIYFVIAGVVLGL